MPFVLHHDLRQGSVAEWNAHPTVILHCAGVPRESMDKERRVALTPQGAAALIKAGLKVNVEEGAGARAQFSVRPLLWGAPGALCHSGFMSSWDSLSAPLECIEL
jgi:hypothetical protein